MGDYGVLAPGSWRLGIRFNFGLFVPHLSPKDTYPSQLVHLGSQTAKPCRAAQQKKHTCRSQMRIASNSATPITCKQGQCEFGARRTRLYRAENRGRRALRGTGNLRCLMKLTWTFTTHQLSLSPLWRWGWLIWVHGLRKTHEGPHHMLIRLVHYLRVEYPAEGKGAILEWCFMIFNWNEAQTENT